MDIKKPVCEYIFKRGKNKDKQCNKVNCKNKSHISLGECMVCITEYDKVSNKKIKCQHCDFHICIKCIKIYILESNEPHCMECKKIFSDDYLVKNLKRTWFNNDYKNRRKQLLFENEISLLQESQEEANNIKKIRNKENELLAIIDELRENGVDFNNNNNNHSSPLDNFIIRPNNENNKVKDLCLLKRRSELTYEILMLKENNGGNKKEKKKFIKKCPNEDCRGFLSSAWKCDLCDNFICNKCHEIKKSRIDESHICNEDDVKTVDLINKDCKPCPKCSVLIYKISGCAQMWCTNCKIAFSWNTGKIIQTTYFHNPHYLEYIRNNSNNANININGDLQCVGAGLDNEDMIDLLIRNSRNLDVHEEFMVIYRFLGECRDRINNNNENVIGNIRNNNDLRVKYLLKDINEEQFKTRIIKRDRDMKKNIEFIQILEMLVNTITDILQRFSQDRNINTLNESWNVIIYSNEALLNFYKKWNVTNRNRLIKYFFNSIRVNSDNFLNSRSFRKEHFRRVKKYGHYYRNDFGRLLII